MGVLGARARVKRTLGPTLGAAFVGAFLLACAPLPQQQVPSDWHEMGESQHLTVGTDGSFDMALSAVDRVHTCPSRVEPTQEIEGDFLVLTFSYEYTNPDPQALAVATAPEHFELIDADEEVVGRFNGSTTWECYQDSELLPMLALPGEAGEGFVVMEVVAPLEQVAVSFNDHQGSHLRWDISEATDIS